MTKEEEAFIKWNGLRTGSSDDLKIWSSELYCLAHDDDLKIWRAGCEWQKEHDIKEIQDLKKAIEIYRNDLAEKRGV